MLISLLNFGENVDVSVGVRDIQSDHQKHLVHMFSLLVMKAESSTASTRVIEVSSFPPKDSDISSVRLNLSIIVSRILCTHIKGLKQFASLVPPHIFHKHSKAMAEKSEVVVLVVLYQNEASHQGMLEIMRQQHIDLEREFNGVVPSGGDLLTCALNNM